MSVYLFAGGLPSTKRQSCFTWSFPKCLHVLIDLIKLKSNIFRQLSTSDQVSLC